MDNETRERFHTVDRRQDGFERLLQEQARAFADFRDMVNTWAKRFAYIVITIAVVNLDNPEGASYLISTASKVFGL